MSARYLYTVEFSSDTLIRLHVLAESDHEYVTAPSLTSGMTTVVPKERMGGYATTPLGAYQAAIDGVTREIGRAEVAAASYQDVANQHRVRRDELRRARDAWKERKHAEV